MAAFVLCTVLLFVMVLSGFPLASEAVSGDPEPTVPPSVAVEMPRVADPPAQWRHL